MTLIPSSLTRDDPELQTIRSAMRHHDLRTRVAIPRAGIPALLGGSRRWRRVSVALRWVRIDQRFLEGTRIGLVSISPERRKGPFALDLAAHFLHPFDRARLLLSHNPSSMVARIAAGTLPDSWIISTLVGEDQLWLTTTDIIATELWSLALAERFFDASLEMQGPWEEPTVQHATELELGARIPSEMRLRFVSPGALPRHAAELLASGCRRLGMRPPAELR